MKINLTGKDINITKDIVHEAERKYDRLDKYFSNEQDLDLLISKEGNDYKAEATMYLDKGPILRAESAEKTYQNAIDNTIDALVRQIRKHKTRLTKDRYQNSIRFENFNDSFDDEYDIDDSYDSDIKIARTKNISLKPMNTEEAVMQMELLDHDFFVFYDAEDMDVRVVYKRRKGDYGLIVPSR